MAVRHLLLGASVLAFAAGSASAQNIINIQSTSSTTNNNSCNQSAGSDGNQCYIIQDGTGNTAQSNQVNGDGNYSLINQQQENGGPVTGNTARHTQRGDRNSAQTRQFTDNNTSTVYQFSTAAIGLNQIGNIADVRQKGDDSNISDVQQAGRAQTATVTQTGLNNYSQVVQGDTVNNNGQRLNTGMLGMGNEASVTITGDNMSSTVDQRSANGLVQNNTATAILVNNPANFTTGTGQAANRSAITQSSSNNIAVAAVANGDSIVVPGTAFNASSITQSVGGANEAYVSIGNPNNASRASQNSTATVTQNSTVGANYGEVTITGGISGNDPQNDPTIGADTFGLNGGNNAQLIQTGSTGRSTALLTISKAADFQALGNNVLVIQQADAAYAGATSAAQGSAATADRIAVSEPAYQQALDAAGQFAAVWSTGRFGQVTLQQFDFTADSGRVYTDGSGNVTGVARSRADIAQGGELNSASVVQFGDNFASITQGRVGSTNQPADRRNTLQLFQFDAGDGPGSTTPGTPVTTVDEFGNPTTTTPTTANPGARQYNQFVGTQYGVSNVIDAQQNARNAFMNVFQGTNNGTTAVPTNQAQPTGLYGELSQGTGETNTYVGAGTGQVGVQQPLVNTTPANGSGLNSGGNSVGATLNFVQGGLNNGTRVYQDSSNSVVNVTQLGSVAGAPAASAADFTTGASQGANVGNLILVAQQGSGNRVTAIQTSTAGRSAPNGPSTGNTAAENTAINGGVATPADDFYFDGVSGRSSQIDILQGGLNNKAYARQEGRGQYARIEQTGTNNEAGILQEMTATNATAVIRQSGSGNSYYIDQTTPGQYVAVDQSGTNNSSNQVRVRGAAGGSNGFTPYAGFPGF